MKSKITTFSLFFLCFAIVASAQIKGNTYKGKVFKMKVFHKLWKLSTKKDKHQSGAELDIVLAQWTDCFISVTVYNGLHISKFNNMNADSMKENMRNHFIKDKKGFKWMKKPKKRPVRAWRNKKLLSAEARGIPMVRIQKGDKVERIPDPKGRTFVKGQFYVPASSSTIVVYYHYPYAFLKIRSSRKHIGLLFKTLGSIQKN